VEILHKIKDIWNKVKALVKPYSKKAVGFLKISAKKIVNFCRELYFKVMSEKTREKISAFCKVVLENGKKPYLLPENPDFDPIHPEHMEILGRVVGSYRKY
jgi:hypothetical protein